MVNRFAIYAPILGKREDYPWIFLSKAITKDNTAIQIWDGELRKAKMSAPDFVMNSDHIASNDPANKDFRKVGFPDGHAALNYRRLLLSDGTERFVGFTEDHIYYWDSTLTKW